MWYKNDFINQLQSGNPTSLPKLHVLRVNLKSKLVEENKIEFLNVKRHYIPI
jgi:hypothetical protein